jgi:plastocyanin
MRRLLFALAVPLIVACDDTGIGPQEPLEEATVLTTAQQRFSPSSVELVQGGTVTWSFNSVGHTVTFSSTTGAPQSIPLSANVSISRVFNTTGTFSYICQVHPSTMTGTIVVR